MTFSSFYLNKTGNLKKTELTKDLAHYQTKIRIKLKEIEENSYIDAEWKTIKETITYVTEESIGRQMLVRNIH